MFCSSESESVEEADTISSPLLKSNQSLESLVLSLLWQ